MGKARLIAYAFASMVALSGAVSADGPGPVTGPVVVDERPCVFFQTNGGYAWYSLPKTADPAWNPWNINFTNIDAQTAALFFSKKGDGSVGFWTDERQACGLPYAVGLSLQ